MADYTHPHVLVIDEIGPKDNAANVLFQVVNFTQLIPARGVDDHGRLRTLVYRAITESGAVAGRAMAVAR